MKSIHIRDVEPAVIEALKRRAHGHHRSLQGELRSILEGAARTAPPAEPPTVSWVTVETGSTAGWSRNEIYDDDGR